jgi:hypothetical protein
LFTLPANKSDKTQTMPEDSTRAQPPVYESVLIKIHASGPREGRYGARGRQSDIIVCLHSAAEMVLRPRDIRIKKRLLFADAHT